MPPKKKPRITRATTPAPKNRSKRTARNQEPILDSIGTVNVQAQTQAVQTPETAATQVPHQVGDVVTCATTSSLDQRGDAAKQWACKVCRGNYTVHNKSLSPVSKKSGFLRAIVKIFLSWRQRSRTPSHLTAYWML
ncbi:uncharacterized protein LOC111112582 isoform X5 [Crassostrea virginica]